jgi:hypothetical protein
MSDNKQTTEFLGGQVTITATSDREIVIVADEDSNVVVNRMPLEFRIWVKRNNMGQWMCSNIFAYRIDPDRPFYQPPSPGTDNQRSKLYRAAVETAERLEGSFLHSGKVVAARRDMEYAARDHEETRKRLVEATQAYEAVLAENIV